MFDRIIIPQNILSNIMAANAHYFLILFLLITATACNEKVPDVVSSQQALQERLITAEPGDTIRIDSGTLQLTRQLSLLDIENVTITGMGADQTILSFKDQVEGAEGLLVRANGITVENLSIIDTKGDGLKVQNADGVTLRNVHVSWSGGPSESNGGYGLYPIGSGNVLIEHCVVSGASDAGIYVGQSEDIIVRHNRVFNNVAGIEIENSIGAEVYDNEVHENTGGILVFDLPGLMLKNGHDINVYRNQIVNNNHRNFAPEGNIVGMVPAGTGILVMATDQVRIYDNVIHNHNTVNTSIISYLLTELEFNDPEYSPFTSGVLVYNNEFERTPALPDTTKTMGQLLASIFETDVPDIIYDGVMNPDHINADGTVESENRICIGENNRVSFANINAPSGFSAVSNDPEPYRCPPEMFSMMRN